MDDLKTSEQLKDFLLARQELEDDFIFYTEVCWGASWAKDHWIIRADNKRMGTLDPQDFQFILKDQDFILNFISALRLISKKTLNKVEDTPVEPQDIFNSVKNILLEEGIEGVLSAARN